MFQCGILIVDLIFWYIWFTMSGLLAVSQLLLCPRWSFLIYSRRLIGTTYRVLTSRQLPSFSRDVLMLCPRCSTDLSPFNFRPLSPNLTDNPCILGSLGNNILFLFRLCLSSSWIVSCSFCSTLFCLLSRDASTYCVPIDTRFILLLSRWLNNEAFCLIRGLLMVE